MLIWSLGGTSLIVDFRSHGERLIEREFSDVVFVSANKILAVEKCGRVGGEARVRRLILTDRQFDSTTVELVVDAIEICQNTQRVFTIERELFVERRLSDLETLTEYPLDVGVGIAMKRSEDLTFMSDGRLHVFSKESGQVFDLGESEVLSESFNGRHLLVESNDKRFVFNLRTGTRSQIGHTRHLWTAGDAGEILHIPGHGLCISVYDSPILFQTFFRIGQNNRRIDCYDFVDKSRLLGIDRKVVFVSSREWLKRRFFKKARLTNVEVDVSLPSDLNPDLCSFWDDLYLSRQNGGFQLRRFSNNKVQLASTGSIVAFADIGDRRLAIGIRGGLTQIYDVKAGRMIARFQGIVDIDHDQIDPVDILKRHGQFWIRKMSSETGFSVFSGLDFRKLGDVEVKRYLGDAVLTTDGHLVKMENSEGKGPSKFKRSARIVTEPLAWSDRLDHVVDVRNGELWLCVDPWSMDTQPERISLKFRKTA